MTDEERGLKVIEALSEVGCVIESKWASVIGRCFRVYGEEMVSEAYEEVIRLRGEAYFEFEAKTINPDAKRSAGEAIEEYVKLIRALKTRLAGEVKP